MATKSNKSNTPAYNMPQTLTDEIKAVELYPGEYQELLDATIKIFKNAGHKNPGSAAGNWMQGVFWTRLTGDQGYFKAVYAQYGDIMKNGSH